MKFRSSVQVASSHCLVHRTRFSRRELADTTWMFNFVNVKCEPTLFLCIRTLHLQNTRLIFAQN